MWLKKGHAREDDRVEKKKLQARADDSVEQGAG